MDASDPIRPSKNSCGTGAVHIWISGSLARLAPRNDELVFFGCLKFESELRMPQAYSGAALSPPRLDSFEANEASMMTTAIKPITSVQIALISGFTPSRTSE